MLWLRKKRKNRQEKEQGLPVDTTRDLVLKLAEQEEGKLYLTEAEHTKSVEALNKLRDTYLKNGRYSDGIDSVLLKIMKSDTAAHTVDGEDKERMWYEYTEI